MNLKIYPIYLNILLKIITNFLSPKVFISYSHDSQTHKDLVLALSDRLRSDGIDCNIDQYEQSPLEGWQRWMINQVEAAKFVLVVCSEPYERKFRGHEEIGKGKGATWEGGSIILELYDAQGSNSKFIPISLTIDDSHFIPSPLRGATCYELITDDGYDLLYRRLTDQHLTPKPELGEFQKFPKRERKPFAPDILNSHRPPEMLPPEQRAVGAIVPPQSLKEIIEATVSENNNYELYVKQTDTYSNTIADKILDLAINYWNCFRGLKTNFIRKKIKCLSNTVQEYKIIIKSSNLEFLESDNKIFEESEINVLRLRLKVAWDYNREKSKLILTSGELKSIGITETREGSDCGYYDFEAKIDIAGMVTTSEKSRKAFQNKQIPNEDLDICHSSSIYGFLALKKHIILSLNSISINDFDEFNAPETIKNRLRQVAYYLKKGTQGKEFSQEEAILNNPEGNNTEIEGHFFIKNGKIIQSTVEEEGGNIIKCTLELVWDYECYEKFGRTNKIFKREYRTDQGIYTFKISFEDNNRLTVMDQENRDKLPRFAFDRDKMFYDQSAHYAFKALRERVIDPLCSSYRSKYLK